MKKLHLLSIFAMLAVVCIAFTSCDILQDDSSEPSMKDDGEIDIRLTEWVEPYAVMKATPAEVKAYMTKHQPRYQLMSESTKQGITFLGYVAPDCRSLGMAYTISDYYGGLHQVLVTEYSVNKDLVLKVLDAKYIKTEDPEDADSPVPILGRYVNDKRDMDIKVYGTTKDAFVVAYTKKLII